ncbi:hypothetical protein F5879DRAFT_993678 [Lentinula edodes]|uniref:uncharacterized protein n=1 Tax=Lentinula edodes TaxID=5353 RepID=UPI001E8CBB23|nr:uncharacterized protein C8R40DRAFT_1169722 [Lentinula edodes]KAH7876070.1 hypothetical protein C8R40DRAFT_1169722 [Lentinula edodes]KAJ3899556.1 hypothetical protein F5879DRAFT_993678 [Lentinula edodes]
MNTFTTRKAQEAPDWEEVVRVNHDRTQQQLSLPPALISELQEQWLELARFHIERLRKEIQKKEQKIANLEKENTRLRLQIENPAEKNPKKIKVSPKECRKIWRY